MSDCRCSSPPCSTSSTSHPTFPPPASSSASSLFSVKSASPWSQLKAQRANPHHLALPAPRGRRCTCTSSPSPRSSTLRSHAARHALFDTYTSPRASPTPSGMVTSSRGSTLRTCSRPSARHSSRTRHCGLPPCLSGCSSSCRTSYQLLLRRGAPLPLRRKVCPTSAVRVGWSLCSFGAASGYDKHRVQTSERDLICSRADARPPAFGEPRLDLGLLAAVIIQRGATLDD